MSTVPAEYPPPFTASDYIVAPQAAEDERIDVGVLIVGAGPAGLATAVRLGQLLAEDPELAEQLGEVPIAVAEKGKAPGSHLLSGAVMTPGPLKALFPDVADDDFPRYGEVTGESVYFMRPKAKLRIPTPPQMKNHGNWVVSISQLARWMSDQAEELGALHAPRDRLPEAADRPGPGHGRRHRRQGPRPRRRGAVDLRARRRGAGPGDRPRRGHAGPPHRRRARATSTSTATPPRSGSSG